jgi:hypothetical protein
MTRIHVTVLSVLLHLLPATGGAQPPENPDTDDAAIGPVRVETLELEPTVVKTGDLILQRYRVRFPDLIAEGQEIIILEDRMAYETLPVHPFEGVSLEIEKDRIDDEHIWDFVYGFRLVDPTKMTYILPNFSFYYLIRDLGEDLEDAEVQQVDGGQGLVRYVTTVTDEPVLDIRDTIELGSFAGRSVFFRTLTWTVAPLPMFVWLVMLVRLARKPKMVSLEKAAEEEELARIEAQIPIPPSIWEARRHLRGELRMLEDLVPGASSESLGAVQRGLVVAFRDYLRAELPDVHPGDTARDIQRHVEGGADGPRKDALLVVASRMVAYQRGLEYGEPVPIDSPGDEAQSLGEALSRLRPHVQLFNRMMALVGR